MAYNPPTVHFNTCGLEIAHWIMCLDNHGRERNRDHAVTRSWYFVVATDWFCLKLVGFYKVNFDSILSDCRFLDKPMHRKSRIQHGRSPYLYTCRAPDAGLLEHGLPCSIGLQGFGWQVSYRNRWFLNWVSRDKYPGKLCILHVAFLSCFENHITWCAPGNPFLSCPSIFFWETSSAYERN